MLKPNYSLLSTSSILDKLISGGRLIARMNKVLYEVKPMSDKQYRHWLDLRGIVIKRIKKLNRYIKRREAKSQ